MIRLIVMGIALAAASTPLNSSQSADPLDDLFKRARVVQQSIKTLKASFTETTVSTLLRDPVVGNGTVTAAVPLRVVMDYRTPVVKTVALDQKRMIVVWPGRPQREEFDISTVQRRVDKYFVDVSLKDLRQTFDVTLAPEPASAGSYRLLLIPKRKQVAEGMVRLELWIDRGSLMLNKMAISYATGDSKTLELRDISVNPNIDEAEFALLRRNPR